MKRLLALIIVLCVVAPAQADRWPVAQVLKAEQVADNYWPNSVCYGHHNITWLDDAGMAQLAQSWGLPPTDDTHPGGYAAFGTVSTPDSPNCNVWIDWQKVGSIQILCTVLTHEFGHNSGLQHSPDPKSVMNGTIFNMTPECIDAFKPTPKPRPPHGHRKVVMVEKEKRHHA